LLRFVAGAAAVSGMDDDHSVGGSGAPALKGFATELGSSTPAGAVGPLGAEGVGEGPFEAGDFNAMPVDHRDE
jgi:hypothetical protein